MSHISKQAILKFISKGDYYVEANYNKYKPTVSLQYLLTVPSVCRSHYYASALKRYTVTFQIVLFIYEKFIH